MLTVVVDPVQLDVAEKGKLALGGAGSVTVGNAPRVGGLPKASSPWRVAAAEQAPAVTVCGAVVNARVLGVPGLMVSVWLAAENPLDVPAMEGVPAAVLLK